MTWDEMNDEEQLVTVRNMQKFGGGFASAIGDALFRADSFNADRIVKAFPDLIEKYQPKNWRTS